MLIIRGFVSLPAAQEGMGALDRVTMTSEGVVLGQAGWMVSVERGVLWEEGLVGWMDG